MSVRAVRWLVALYMVLFAALTTWPGASLISAVEPFIAGLPFNLFAIALLIIGGLGLLTALYISEKRVSHTPIPDASPTDIRGEP
ncbi:MAG: hypothetical protein AAF291_07355 [Pseudomonadota bacterium]